MFPPIRESSTLMVKTLLHRPLWWAGTGAAVTGYAFQALALAYGSLLLVAPLLVATLHLRPAAERMGVPPTGRSGRVGRC